MLCKISSGRKVSETLGFSRGFFLSFLPLPNAKLIELFLALGKDFLEISFGFQYMLEFNGFIS